MIPDWLSLFCQILFVLFVGAVFATFFAMLWQLMWDDWKHSRR